MFNQIARCAGLGSVVWVMSVAACGRPSSGAEAPGIDPAVITAAEAMMDSLLVAKSLPGLAVAVAVGGELVWADGFGWADVEAKLSVMPQTQFRVGSVSKLFTAAAAGRLYEQGRLDLDAPVQRWVAEFPESNPPITPRLLLGHLSGIRHYGDDYMNDRQYTDVLQALEKFSADPLRGGPGAAYLYSSYGYNLLGGVLQRASGVEFRDLVRTLVLEPAGMTRTIAEERGQADSDRAKPYDEGETGGHQLSDFIDLSDRWPSGGYLSTAEDLARFGVALLTSQLLEPATRELAFAEMRTTAGEPTGAGWSWRIARDEDGHRILHHGGSSLGGRAFVLLVPDDQIVIAMLSNLSFADFAEEEAIALADLFSRP